MDTKRRKIHENRFSEKGSCIAWPLRSRADLLWFIMMRRSYLAFLMIVLISGCATQRPPLPENTITLGSIRGLKAIRYWGDENLYAPQAYATEIRKQILSTDPAELNRPQYFLAISGGGQRGAFGAGLLNGWSQHGDRPPFRVVTGISTGALIAPFAFLGKDYDASLKELYTLYSTKDILSKSILSGLFGGDAIADSKPLFLLIEEYLDAQAITRIAAEHQKGRRLLIGTTYMDALRPVIWDLGAIAVSDHPKKDELIHQVILASMSVPGVFPPVMFDVYKDETQYNELHMDGGIGNQIFISPVSYDNRKELDIIGFTNACKIFMIRNSVAHTDWQLVKPSAFSLTKASIRGLTRNQGNTNQSIIYLMAIRDKIECYSARIPGSFNVQPMEVFDKSYMQQLYNYAFELARNSYPWESSPE